MKALILAAGRGQRLGGGDAPPKCLLEVGGRTLLARMLGALRAVGVASASLVVGFQQDRVREAALAIPVRARPDLTFLENHRFTQGSVVSLWIGRAAFGEDLLIMDADVLFPEALLRRLVEEAPPSAFLLDPRSEAGGEEMMLVAAPEGRVRRIARRVEVEPGEVVGEGVGFLKLRAADQPALAAQLERLVAAGEVGRDYEDAIDAALREVEVGYALVGDLPWTEIDFPEDVERARAEVLPAIEGAA